MLDSDKNGQKMMGHGNYFVDWFIKYLFLDREYLPVVPNKPSV